MPVNNLSIAYHQQDTDHYCGAACAQMVLDSVGAGLLDQKPLYDDNHSNSTTEPYWDTGPDGLELTMKDRTPTGLQKSFVLFELASEEAISRKIVWTIHRYGVAPIALVEGLEHWIVVRGFDVSDDPSNSTDTAYTINAFFLNNPWPPPPDDLSPLLHGNGTDGCGTGGCRGLANEHVAYATWQDTYMTGVPDGHWAGKFLAVCDPDPPAPTPGRAARRESPFRGDEILPPELAKDLAVKGVNEYGLREQAGWSEALVDVQAGEPLLVQRLDRVDSYYYLVPLRSTAPGAGVVVSVDARSGDYRQAAIDPHQDELLLRAEERDLLVDRLEANRPLLEGLRREGLVLRREALSLSSALVWKPCRESLSPFYPFYVFTFGDWQLYLRVDGRLFTRLTPGRRG